MSAHWRRDDPQLLNVYELGWSRVDDASALQRADAKVLSRDEASGSATYLARLHAGWRHEERADDATLEVVVLAGDLAADGDRVGAGGFVAVPRGAGPCRLSTAGGATALVLVEPELSAENAYPDGVRVSKSWQLPWIATDLTGMRHGIMHKSLRLPDVAEGPVHGGPNGLLRLVLMAPGFAEDRQEAHPEWEEILFLSGEFFMPGRGLCGPGTLLGNPAGVDHGPLVTQRGSLMLVHTTAPVGSEFSPAPGGPEITEHFLDTRSLLEPPLTAAWETLPEYEVWREIVGERATGRA